MSDRPAFWLSPRLQSGYVIEARKKMEGVMQKSKRLSRILQAAVCALILTVMAPVVAFGQRLVVVRPRTRSRIVVYQPRPYAIYQRPSYYRSYDYSYPGYSSGYYSYRNTQPYFANPYTYSYANPTYRYYESGYRPRHRHSGIRIWWR